MKRTNIKKFMIQWYSDRTFCPNAINDLTYLCSNFAHDYTFA